MIIIYIGIFACFSAQARLIDLASEFLKSNSNIKILELDVKQAELEKDRVSAVNDLTLTYQATKENSFPEGLFFFNNFKQRSLTNELSLSKRFSFGTEIQLSQTVIENDFSEWPGRPEFLESIVHQYVSGLVITQDLGANLFGQSYRKEIEIAEQQSVLARYRVDSETERNLLEFVIAYFQAKLNKTIYQLNKQALARAQKRLDLIKRREREGLSLKVDLLQAQNSFMALEENLRGTQNMFLENLEALSNFNHRRFTDDEIATYQFKKNAQVRLVEESLRENRDLKTIQIQLEIAEAALKNAEYQTYPTVQLIGSYRSNAIDNDLSGALRDGFYGGPRDIRSIGIRLSMPLGNTLAKTNQANQKIEVSRAHFQKESLEINLKNSISTLNSRIEILNQNIVSAENRISIVQKLLEERNRLYLQGRSELDQVIAAEEVYIQVQLDYSRYLSQRDLLASTHASLFNKLIHFLENYSQFL